jgi:5-methylcytosine-specific restriction enzyme subunit McrC
MDSKFSWVPLFEELATKLLIYKDDRTLIIDAKYYTHSLSEHIGKNLLHSPNFYQINSYVLNHDAEHTGMVDGMLLYAQTQDEGKMNYSYPHRDGNVFYVKSLDLNQDFDSIKAQLENIVSCCNCTQQSKIYWCPVKHKYPYKNGLIPCRSQPFDLSLYLAQ